MSELPGQEMLNDVLIEHYARVVRRSMTQDLPLAAEPDDAEIVNWSALLRWCSLLTLFDDEAAHDVTLRVCQVCLESGDASAEHRAAAAELLKRRGNDPAIALAAARQLVDRESWTGLPSPIMLDHIRSALELAVPVGESESVHVNEFQRQFWTGATVNDWLSVSAPTSAGKSYIVRKWIEHRLAGRDRFRCVYLVPTRALIDEVSTEIRSQFRDLDVEVHTLPWDSEAGQRDREVMVFTQERLHLMHDRDESFAADLTIIDEAQKFGDDSRGVLLQQVLDETVRRAPEGQVVFASPLSTNPELLLDSAPEDVRAEALTGMSVTVSQNLFWVNQVPRKPTQWTIESPSEPASNPLGNVVLPNRPSPASKRLPFLAVALGATSASNVIYVNGAADAEKVARQVYEASTVDESDSSPEIEALIELVERTIHPEYALATVLRRGVAFHYGNMPQLVRAEVERLFRTSKIRYLVCTSTLLEGVNLPCQNLFVRGPRKGRGRPMEAADFWNLAGRAGRWGKEFRGNIFCIDTSQSDQWPHPPRERVRYPLRRATDDALGDVERLLRFVRDGTPRNEGGGSPPLESVFSYLACRVVSGEAIEGLPSLRHLEPSDVVRVQQAVATAVETVELPAGLLSRHLGISPVLMQELLVDFRSHDRPDDLGLALPESRDAVDSMVSAIGRVQRTLGGSFGPPGRQYMLALLVVQWMRGLPLAQIISERIGNLQRRGGAVEIPKVIRECMRDVEQTARFEAPKFLACYVDILTFHLGQIGREDLAADIPDVAMLLELGVSRTTEVSAMALGLSRTTAIAISEFIVQDDLSSAGVRAWLIEADLRSLGLPVLVRAELEDILGASSQES